MIEANTVDTPTISNHTHNQMIPMPGNIAGNALRGKSFADKNNYPQKSGVSMPTKSRETWKDWFDDADQVEHVTLDELFQEFPLDGVTADKVRYWQKADVIPQAVKMWHQGATRALYPATYAFMVLAELQILQKRGYTLAQIRDRLRRRAHAWNLGGRGDHHEWKPTASQLADEFEELTGNHVMEVRISFIDEDGETDTYTYDVGSD